MRDLSDFEKRQIVGPRLDGASATKTAILLCVLRVTVSKVMSPWEDNISEEEQWAKINTDRKRSSYSQKDCFKKSHCYCSTGDKTAELNIHLEDPVSTKAFNVSFTNPTSMVEVKLLNVC
jgi:hypothetical protein